MSRRTMEYILFNAPLIWSDLQRTDIVPNAIESGGSRRYMTNNAYSEVREPLRLAESTGPRRTLKSYGVPTPQESPLDDTIAHKSTAEDDKGSRGRGCYRRSWATETISNCGTDESTPTSLKSRRKAQNRAAQHAFLERRKKHIQHLEANISTLECKKNTLLAENEELESVLKRICADNEALRTASLQSDTSSTNSRPASDRSPSEHESRDTDYTLQRLSTIEDSGFVDQEQATSLQAKVGKIQATTAWYLLQSHPLVQQGTIDVSHVYGWFTDSVYQRETGTVSELNGLLQTKCK